MFHCFGICFSTGDLHLIMAEFAFGCVVLLFHCLLTVGSRWFCFVVFSFLRCGLCCKISSPICISVLVQTNGEPWARLPRWPRL